MKITLTDGSQIELPFTAAAHGFVAHSIEITLDDLVAMRRMARLDPDRFEAYTHQLEPLPGRGLLPAGHHGQWRDPQHQRREGLMAAPKLHWKKL